MKLIDALPPKEGDKYITPIQIAENDYYEEQEDDFIDYELAEKEAGEREREGEGEGDLNGAGEVIIMNDGFIFDNIDIACDNPECKPSKELFPRGLFLNDSVSLCLGCYVSGYRPCIYSSNIYHISEMTEIGKNMYVNADYTNYFQEYIQNPEIGLDKFIN